jgi:hypothetical protein
MTTQVRNELALVDCPSRSARRAADGQPGHTVLNVALSTLVRDLHATTTQLLWVVDACVLVFASSAAWT